VEGSGVMVSNLLTFKKYELLTYKNVKYIQFQNGYMILKPTQLQYDEIDEHFLYSHYVIDNDYTTIYEGIWSNSYDWAVNNQEQLSLF
jgi:hypothetical protein